MFYLFYLHLQYNHKNGNETAVREEMVELANLVDGVRFQVVCKRKFAQF